MPGLAELERQARERLDRAAYDYFAGGADDELTLAANPAAWARLAFRPHVLRDVGAISTRTTVLGAPVEAPVLVAPIAYQRLAHPDGELATAGGTAAAGTLMIVSTQATATIEEVAAVAPDAPRWFQLYVYRDRGGAADLGGAAVGVRGCVHCASAGSGRGGHPRRDITHANRMYGLFRLGRFASAREVASRLFREEDVGHEAYLWDWRKSLDNATVINVNTRQYAVQLALDIAREAGDISQISLWAGRAESLGLAPEA